MTAAAPPRPEPPAASARIVPSARVDVAKPDPQPHVARYAAACAASEAWQAERDAERAAWRAAHGLPEPRPYVPPAALEADGVVRFLGQWIGDGGEPATAAELWASIPLACAALVGDAKDGDPVKATGHRLRTLAKRPELPGGWRVVAVRRKNTGRVWAMVDARTGEEPGDPVAELLAKWHHVYADAPTDPHDAWPAVEIEAGRIVTARKWKCGPQRHHLRRFLNELDGRPCGRWRAVECPAGVGHALGGGRLWRVVPYHLGAPSDLPEAGRGRRTTRSVAAPARPAGEASAAPGPPPVAPGRRPPPPAAPDAPAVLPVWDDAAEGWRLLPAGAAR